MFQTFFTLQQKTHSRHRWKFRMYTHCISDDEKFMHHVMESSGPSVFLFAYYPQQFIQLTKCRLKQLLSLNMNLVIFLDGPAQPGKENELLRRMKQKRIKIENFFNSMKPGEAFFNEYRKRWDTFSLPLLKQLYYEVLVRVAEENSGLVVKRLPGEADLEVAKCCKLENHFAVVGGDSDYFIYDIPGYIPVDKIQFKEDTVICDFFSPKSIAQKFTEMIKENYKVKRPITVKVMRIFHKYNPVSYYQIFLV